MAELDATNELLSRVHIVHLNRTGRNWTNVDSRQTLSCSVLFGSDEMKWDEIS